MLGRCLNIDLMCIACLPTKRRYTANSMYSFDIMNYAALAMLALSLLLLAHDSLAQAVSSAIMPLGPIRIDWGNLVPPYCGELSIQQTALYHGVWVGQEQARRLGGGELLLGVNLERVVAQLGFLSVKRIGTAQAGVVPSAALQQHMVWIKNQVLRNYTVIFGARIEGGEDTEYDHIMPIYGVVLHTPPTSGGSPVYDSRDELIWSNVYGQQLRRAMGAPSFYAARYE